MVYLILEYMQLHLIFTLLPSVLKQHKVLLMLMVGPEVFGSILHQTELALELHLLYRLATLTQGGLLG